MATASEVATTARRAVVGRELPRRLRVRLTLLYGALSLASGAVLLGLTYLLFESLTDKRLFVDGGTVAPSVGVGTPPPNNVGPGPLPDLSSVLAEQAKLQHQADLQHLLAQSGVALAIMGVVSLLIGWLVAGRVLRPVRTMTTSLQRISATNLHQRLAAAGPRDELKDLSDTVDDLLARLESSLEAQQRFVANAAHELRTPLTIEHALLEEPLIDPDADLEDYRSNFRRLLGVNERRARLLESLLTLSSTESGLKRSEPVELADVVERVAVGFAGAAQHRGLHLSTSTVPGEIHGDAILLEQLVFNLVDNAISYNCEGGQLDIATRTDEGHTVLRVTNTGATIPPDQVKGLFDPFQRLDRTAADGHHGLGLSIVHAIVVAHGAQLHAAPAAGGGLEIEVTFPIKPVKNPPIRAGW